MRGWTRSAALKSPRPRYSANCGRRSRPASAMPWSVLRRRPSSSPALRLNQRISCWALSTTTPSGMAAEERRSSRNSDSRRCLWNCLRRCRRETCETTSPHRPPAAGGARRLRLRSQWSSWLRFDHWRRSARASAPVRPHQGWPIAQPTRRPSATMPAKRDRANPQSRNPSFRTPTPCGRRSDIPRRAPSAPDDRTRIPPAPCAAGGCARRWCAPRHRRSRPRCGQGAARGSTHGRDGS